MISNESFVLGRNMRWKLINKEDDVSINATLILMHSHNVLGSCSPQEFEDTDFVLSEFNQTHSCPAGKSMLLRTHIPFADGNATVLVERYSEVVHGADYDVDYVAVSGTESFVVAGSLCMTLFATLSVL